MFFINYNPLLSSIADKQNCTTNKRAPLYLQKLPATANSKIIDSWLLFCVAMIVVAIVLHTVIGFLSRGGSRSKGQMIISKEHMYTVVLDIRSIYVCTKLDMKVRDKNTGSNSVLALLRYLRIYIYI